VDLDQYVTLPQHRIRHFSNPYAILFSIAIDNECLQMFSFQVRGESDLEVRPIEFAHVR
jgi:hypothetical protein